MKVGIISTSRADYNYYLPLLREMKKDSFFDLTIFALGMHVSETFGETHEAFAKDGFNVVCAESTILDGYNPKDIANYMGLTTSAMASLFNNNRTEVVITLGDRYEMLSAALALVPFNVPIIHLYGGEITEGAIDNKFRHALSKIADLHFTSCEQYRKRVIQMGASPEIVYNYGSTAINLMKSIKLYSTTEFNNKFGVNLTKKTYLCTYHSTTTEYENSTVYIEEFIAALEVLDGQVLITLGNADTYSDLFRSRLSSIKRDDLHIFNSLGCIGYYTALKNSYIVVGNSSSGIIEAATYNRPVVNIGNRQRGRACSGNVIHSGYLKEDILEGIKRADNFYGQEFSNIYEGLDTCKNIVNTIKKFNFNAKKSFHDISPNQVLGY